MISLDEPFRFGSSGRMQLCFLLFLTGLHLTAACKLEGNQELQTITAYTGSSVLLPCYCTDLQTKPEGVTWKKDYQYGRREIQTDNVTYRFQLVKHKSPGNLSLIISDLNKEDGGDYMCDVPGNHTIIRLSVKEAQPKPQPPTSNPATKGTTDKASPDKPSTDPPKNLIIIIGAAVGGLLLLLMGLIVIIYWRYRAQRRGRTGSREGQTGRNSQQETQDYTDALYSKINPQSEREEEQEQDDVTYSTVIHDNKTRPANKLMESEETTEYASIKLN